MIDWDDVRYFLEVARNGNVTSAARALGVNHSTVSRRIRALEERYGVRLFERVPSGYVLTDDASDIFETALEIEERNNAFARKLLGQDERLEGLVTLTMPHDIFEFFLAEQLARFNTLYPSIQLELFIAKGLKDLRSREADIAVRLTDAPPEYLVGKEICRLQHALFRANSASSDKETAREQTPLIDWTSNKGTPSWAHGIFPTSFVNIRVDDLLGMYAATEAGFGVSRMPIYIHNMIASEKVEAISETKASSWGVWVLSHIDLKKTKRVQTCRRFITECIQANKHVFSELPK